MKKEIKKIINLFTAMSLIITVVLSGFIACLFIDLYKANEKFGAAQTEIIQLKEVVNYQASQIESLSTLNDALYNDYLDLIVEHNKLTARLTALEKQQLVTVTPLPPIAPPIEEKSEIGDIYIDPTTFPVIIDE